MKTLEKNKKEIESHQQELSKSCSSNIASAEEGDRKQQKSTSSTLDEPKSFFKRKILEDLANKNKLESSKKEISESSSSYISSAEEGECRQQERLMQPPTTSAIQNKPKSFFQMKILEDLANKKRSDSIKQEISESSSNVTEDEGEQKHSTDEEELAEVNSIVKKPEEEVEEEAVIDITELIPSLSTFDPSLMDFLPPKLKSKAKERINLLKEKEKKVEKPGSMASFLKTSLEKEVEEDENCVNCEICHKKVSPFTLPEHLDWHYAVTISKQSNGGTEMNKTSKKPTGKRKRDSLSNSESEKKI